MCKEGGGWSCTWQAADHSRVLWITGWWLPACPGDLPGKTARCHLRFKFPPEWDITHSQKHWSNETTMIQYIEKIIIPYINSVHQSVGNDTPAVIISRAKSQVLKELGAKSMVEMAEYFGDLSLIISTHCDFNINTSISMTLQMRSDMITLYDCS